MSTEIPPDGKIHRWKGASKRGASAWGVSYGNFGAYGDWATGEVETFVNDQRPSKRTHKIILDRVKQDKQKTEYEAAIECYAIWENSIECYGHPYLTKKKVDSFDLRIDGKNRLLIPLCDTNEQIHSLQYINEDGYKLFHKGGRKKGLYYMMGDIEKPLFVCEGYATGASIIMAANVCVAVAFDAGNLLPVVKEIKSVYPYRPIYIAADNDKWKSELGNPGLKYAEQCHNEFQCGVVWPLFKDESTKPTDFNDLHCLEGLGKVYDRIMSVLNA